jgi:hypothetical protein
MSKQIARLTTFDGDKSPALSDDESSHSKEMAAATDPACLPPCGIAL